jgi:DNA topoisomerase-1
MGDKWNTLSHNGVLFPSEYEHQNYPVLVCDKEYHLSKEAEEVAVMWAQKLETVYVKDKTFQKNFWLDFKAFLPKELQETKFPENWDMTKIYSALQKKKEEKKIKTKEEREFEKKEKDAIKNHFGFATINGQKVPLGNYMVEPPGLFMGRGKHPLRGRVKSRIYAEQITLNMSKDAPHPPAPKGHKWLRIVENKNALWTAMWVDPLTGKQKRVLFSPVSFVRQGADQKKFSKAIILAQNFDEVNKFIEKKLKSSDSLTRELATACNIIAKLTIRVGDEKDEDEADTVGCTTLRYEHIKIDGNNVEFDFLGKDSVRYHNVVWFDPYMISNLRELMQGKKKGDMIFSRINSHDVNEFLSIVIPGLSAKQFRTATGSKLLAEELRQKSVPSDMKEIKKIEAYNEANLEVALKLNHQSAVSEAYDKSLDNMKATLIELKKELKEMRAEYDSVEASEKKSRDERVAYAKEKYTGDRQKDSIRRAKDTYSKNMEKVEKRLERIRERVETLTTKIKMKEKTKGVALGTSKTNYSDPRIGISWCKKNGVPVERLYTKTLLEKFSWAQDVEPDFYEKYPEVD